MRKHRQWDRKSFLIGGFFCIAFIIGLFLVKDFGSYIDEMAERRTSLVNYKYIFPSVSNIITTTVDFTKVSALELWKDRYYGVSLQLPTVAIEHLFGFLLPMHTVIYIRHVWVYLFACLSYVYFYRLLKIMTKSRKYSFLGTIIFILNPRILGHAFYNIKDSLFLSVFTINLFYAIRFLRKPEYKKIPLLALTTAFCVNTRIVGAELLAICLLICIVRDGMIQKKWKKTLGLVVLASIGSILIYVAITPVTWSNPVNGILNIVRTFSDYTTWKGSFYYLGHVYSGGEQPWHYVPVWMAVTIPSLYLLLALIGAFSGFKKEKWSWERLLVFAVCAIPMIYVVVTRPVVYNDWRHFYFLWISTAIFAVWGFIDCVEFFEQRKRSEFLYAGLLLYLCYIAFRVGMYHPFEYAYFNPWIEKYAEENMEKDNWTVSQFHSLKKLLELLPEDELSTTKINVGWGQEYEWLKNEKTPVQIGVGSDRDYEIYYLDRGKYDHMMPCEYSTEVSGLTLGGVTYYSGNNNSYCKITENNNDTLTVNLNNVNWKKDRIQDQIRLEGLINSAPISTKRITIETSNAKSLKNLSVYLQNTSGEWILADEIADVIHEGRFVYITLEEISNFGGISIVHDEVATKEDIDWYINFHLDTYMQEKTEYVEAPIEVAATTHLGFDSPVENAFDNDSNTCWTSSAPQETGMVYAFTLKKCCSLSGMDLISGEKWYDAPQNFKIYVSMDQENWIDVTYEKKGTQRVSFDPVLCKYVRIVLDVPEETEYHWSISELVLYETIK